MLKNFLKDSFKLLAGGATFITYQSFYQSLNDQSLKQKIDRLEQNNQELLSKLNNNNLEDVKNELIKTKIEALKLELTDSTKSCSRELDLMKQMEPSTENVNSLYKHYLENYIKSSENSHNTYNKIIEVLDSNKKFCSDSINYFKDILNN